MIFKGPHSDTIILDSSVPESTLKKSSDLCDKTGLIERETTALAKANLPDNPAAEE
jgi:hypothetical protein